jgi:hypothetical protein
MRFFTTSFLLAVALPCSVPFTAPSQGDAGVYRLTTFAGDDEGNLGNWYWAYYARHGRTAPLPEELSASRDTNGYWGEPVDRLQLSGRFHRHEFVLGEPISAMILVRNLTSSSRRLPIRNYSRSETRKNFGYVLRHGTNTSYWSWSDPPPPNPLPNGYQPPKYFLYGHDLEPHSQNVFFVRLDQIFNLKDRGDYSIQVSRAEQPLDGRSAVKLDSGIASFRVVERLSPAEIAATNALAMHLKVLEREAEAALNRDVARRFRVDTNGNVVPRN